MDISNSLNPSYNAQVDKKGKKADEADKTKERNVKGKDSFSSERQASLAGEEASQQKVSEATASSKGEPGRDSAKDRAKSDIARAAIQAIAQQTGGSKKDVQAANSARPTEEKTAGEDAKKSRDTGGKEAIKMIDL